MANNKKHKRPKKITYNPPFPDSVLNESIGNLALREETLNLLLGAGLNTIRDVLIRCETDFYKICKFNKKNLFDVKNAIKKRDLFLRPIPITETQNQNSANVEGGKNKQQNQPNKAQQPTQQTKTQNQPAPQNKAQQPVQQGKQTQNKQGVQASASQNAKQKNKKQQVIPGVNAPLVLKTLPEKPPRPVHVPIKEESDAYVKINKGGKWGFRDRDTKIMVVPTIYDEVFNYKGDICCVQKDEKFGFINRKGEEIIPIIYDCATSFSEGYACVFKGDYCGYINLNNETVIDFKYTAGTPVINGECRVKKENKWGELHLDNPNEVRWII